MRDAVVTHRVAGDLPAEVTSFVGRRLERSAVRTLLTQSREVTLVGFGGIGKTRLALRTASEVRRAFADGVCFVPLGSIDRPEAVADEVAGALGLRGSAGETAAALIVQYLADRRLLLVLDNCEHVIDEAAHIADDVLHHCPFVRILATSREPLRIDGEAVHMVSPLSCPGPSHSGFQLTEAVQLFLDRARSSAPGFTLNEDNRAAVAAICSKLEGIPLAIELAAARLTALSASELDQGLTEHWGLLSRGRRTAPSRQSTMAACIEWSFDLCTPAERKLWAMASVFVDGFERDAAQAVCIDPDDEPLSETLASLVEKSVLSTTVFEAGTRFRMLPPIRQRGLAELEKKYDAAEQGHRHSVFFLELIHRAHQGWLTADQLAWIDRIRREVGNVASTLERCALTPSNVDAGLKACGELLEFVHVQGLFRQGRRWCERLLAMPPTDPVPRARALRAAVWWATMQGDLTAARSMVDESMAMRGVLDSESELLVIQAVGLVSLYEGDLPEARCLLEDAIGGLEAVGNQAELAHSWMLLAIVCAIDDDSVCALSCFAKGMAVAEPSGEGWVRAWLLWAAGIAYWNQGDSASAHDALKRALKLAQLMGEPMGIGSIMETVAWIVIPADPGRGATLLGAAHNEWDKIEAPVFRLAGLEGRHQDAVADGRRLLGDEAFDEAWSRGRSLGRNDAVALCLDDEPAPRSKRVTPRPQLLTAREREISQLIHQGLTNQEIADKLVISRRTAEGHVQNILNKLGLTNRVQVSLWVEDQDIEARMALDDSLA